MSDQKMYGKGNVITSFLWRYAERCGAQGVTFVVSLILARLLDPEVYGIVALVTVFTSILNVFIDSGMGSALIQKKDADDLDFSSVFYFNIVMCSVLYGIMFFAAPAIANFYNNEALIPVVRVVSLNLVISGVKNIQYSYVSKHMMFKKFFFSTLGGTIGAAVIGIAMAYMGCGVWAIIVQGLFNSTVDAIILWITVEWRPKWMFSFTRLKALLSFGWKLLTSNLLDSIYNNLRSIIIGKMYSTGDLSFYNKGKSFPQLVIENVNSSISSVLFPAMSNVSRNTTAVRSMTRRAMKTSIYVIAPLMMGLAFCSETFISLLLTDKWLPCVPYMRIFCVTYMFYPVHTANLSAIQAMGRSDLFLRLEVIKKIIGLALMFVTVFISVEAMAYSLLVSTIISTFINAFPNKYLLGYSWSEQMKDILPNIGLAVVMGIPVLLVQRLALPLIVTLMLQILVGGITYIGLSALLKVEMFEYFLNMAGRFRKK